MERETNNPKMKKDLIKLNGHIPLEIKNFFLQYRKERKKKFCSISVLFQSYLSRYLDNPNKFKFEPEKVELYRKMLDSSIYRNNTNIYISKEDKEKLENIAFANFRTITAQFNLFLFCLYFKLKH